MWNEKLFIQVLAGIEHEDWFHLHRPWWTWEYRLSRSRN